MALALGAVSTHVCGDLGSLLALWWQDDGHGLFLRGQRRAAGSSVNSTPPQQQETGKYKAALSRFDLVPIETGGCSCLVLVPAASGAPWGAGQPRTGGSGVWHSASVLLLPFHVPCSPLCFLVLLLPLGGAVLSPAGALHPPPAVQVSPDPAGARAGHVAPCPGRALCGTRGLFLPHVGSHAVAWCCWCSRPRVFCGDAPAHALLAKNHCRRSLKT